MQLPSKVLLGLSMAIATVGMTGCGLQMPGNSQQQPTSTQNDPNAVHQPNEEPGKVCEPKSCPACGRG